MVISLKVHHHFEATPEHALAVEGQRFRIHHFRQALVLHHLGVHAVAIGARPVDDVREKHRLAGPLLHRARERRALAPGDIVRHAFAELERAVVAPHLARAARHGAVRSELFLGHRGHETINVRHGSLPPFASRAPSRGSGGSAAPRRSRPAPAEYGRRSGSPRSGRAPRSCRSRRGIPSSRRTAHRSPRPCRYARAPWSRWRPVAAPPRRCTGRYPGFPRRRRRSAGRPWPAAPALLRSPDTYISWRF